MLMAFVTICAVEAGIINQNRCLQINDTRGPYATIEQCDARLLEMQRDLATPQIKMMHWQQLGHPQNTNSYFFCEPAGVDT